MKVLIAAFVVVLYLFPVESSCRQVSLSRNRVFLGYSGPENFGSINFERVLSEGGRWAIAVSAGIRPFNMRNSLSIPASATIFTNGKKHHFETGLNTVYLRDKFHPFKYGHQSDFNSRLFLMPFSAYRFQRDKGVFFRAGAGPRIMLDPPGNAVFKPNAVIDGISAIVAVGVGF
jgi:hypothetical protein